MAIRVVKFSNGGTKLERFLPKNQHTLRKFLNFENWVNGGLRSFKKSGFKKSIILISIKGLPVVDYSHWNTTKFHYSLVR